MLFKQDGQYQYQPDKLWLTYSNREIADQLEEIRENAELIRENWQNAGIYSDINWRAVKATVTHDPENFGKAYLVQQINFTK